MSRRVLVVFVDALGADFASELGRRLGFRASALRGVLGYSTGALPTVLTGASPAEHGRMCLFAHKRSGSSVLDGLRWLALVPTWLHERRRVRRCAEAWLRLRHGLSGYVALHRVPPAAFDWLDLPEQEDLFTARTIGGASTFLANARDAGLSVYAAPWQLREEQRWAAAHAAIAAHRADLTFLYSTELDGTMHAAGTASSERPLVRVAEQISRARDALARGGELTTIVVGDHGMADVTRVVDPRPVTRRLSFRHFVDSTMLRMWGTPEELAGARTRLEGAFPGRWLAAQDLVARAAPMADARFGDALWLLPEGTLFAPSFLGGAVRGMHGYDLADASSRAGYLSDDSTPITSLTDVAGVVRRALALA